MGTEVVITYSLLDHKLFTSCDGFSGTEVGHVLRRLSLPALGSAGTCGPWAAGGSIRRAVYDEPLGKDIDLFFSSEESFQSWRAQLIALDKRVWVRNDTSRVLECTITSKHHKPFVLDLVHGTFFPSVEALLEDFDFTCCQFAVDQDHLYVGDLAMLHAGLRLLRANNWAKLQISYPHMVRYLHDGWRVGKNELDALLESLQKSPDVLRRQSEYSGPPDGKNEATGTVAT